jgi:YggT family protein
MGGYFSGAGMIVLTTISGLLLLPLLLRAWLPAIGARFRNPICQFLYQVTNPVIIPLSKVLPNMRRFSLAAIALYLLGVLLLVCVLFVITGSPWSLPALLWLTLGSALQYPLTIALWTIVVFAIMSFFVVDYDHPVAEIVHAMATPLIKPFRRLPPKIQGFDLSPIWAILTIQLSKYTLGFLGLMGSPVAY